MDTLAAAAALAPLSLPSTPTSQTKTTSINTAMTTTTSSGPATTYGPPSATTNSLTTLVPDSPSSGASSHSFSPQFGPGSSSTAVADPNASFSVQLASNLRSLWQSQTMCDLTLRALNAGANDPAALLLMSPRARRVRVAEQDMFIANATSASTNNTNNINQDTTNDAEWCEVKLHSVVAMSASPLIRDLILKKKEQQPEAQHMVLELDAKHVSSHALRTIVTFMYNGRLELHSEREILAVVLAAHYLKMSAVVQTCARLLGKSLAAHNAAHLLALGAQFSLKDLGALATRCIVDNYAVVIATRGWTSLSVDAVERVLRADSLSCDEEMQVVAGLMVWALYTSEGNTEKESRTEAFDRLVNDRDCVRLAHVTPAALPMLVKRLRTEFLARLSVSSPSSLPSTRPGDTSASSSPLAAILRPAPITTDNSSSAAANIVATQPDKHAVEKQRAVETLDVLLDSLGDAVQAEVILRSSNKRMRGPHPRRYSAGRGLPQQCSYTFDDSDRHCGYVYTLTECDGIIYSGSRDSTIKLWSMYSKQCVATVPVNNRVWKLLAVRPEDPCPRLRNHIVSGSWDNVIRIWRKYPHFGPNCSYELRGHRGWILDLLACAGTLVSASADCSVIVWNLATRKPLVSLVGHTKHVYALASVGDLLISGSADNTLRVWNTTTWKCKHVMTGHTNTVRSLLRVGELLWSGGADGNIKVWNCEAGSCVKTIVGHTDWVESLVNVDSSHVASGSRDETIKLWDNTTFECVRVLRGHENWVYSLAVRPNQALISGSADTSVRVWEFGSADREQETQQVNGAVSANTHVPGSGGVGGGSMTLSLSAAAGSNGSPPAVDMIKRARVGTTLLAVSKN